VSGEAAGPSAAACCPSPLRGSAPGRLLSYGALQLVLGRNSAILPNNRTFNAGSVKDNGIFSGASDAQARDMLIFSVHQDKKDRGG